MPGRTLNRASELFLAHRADERLMILERRGEPWVRSAVTVEVGPQADEHPGSPLGSIEQGVDESAPLLVVAAQREYLLELVDDEQVGVARGFQLGERVFSRREERWANRLASCS